MGEDEVKVEKPIVFYNELFNVEVGCGATVVANNHHTLGNPRFGVIHTSTVLSYDPETGDFETLNTQYKKKPV